MTNGVTVRDIAREASVSIGTVSRVLNNHHHVAEATRRHVLEIASGLGYSLPARMDNSTAAASAVREITFLFTPVNRGTHAAANPFWSRILVGAETEAAKCGIKLTYRSLQSSSQSLQIVDEAVRDPRAGGVLLVGPTDPAVVAHLEASSMPLVLVEHHVPGRAFDSVLSDNFAGGRLATQHLIDAGHQRIAFISGPALDGRRPMSTLAPVELRANGYRAALLDAGLPIDYALYEPSNLTPEGGYLACEQLLQRNVAFTALFCANDSTAVGALKALREAGRSVPGDVSLVAYGDYMDIAAQLTPALTTVHTDQVGSGVVAVQRLINRAARPDLPPVLHLLHVELVQRESVKPPSEARTTLQ
jgi:DNA-binding LacI/PurR family transcriptional regulator